MRMQRSLSGHVSDKRKMMYNDHHQQNCTLVPEGTQRYTVVPDVPDHLRYLHPEFEVSVVHGGTWWYVEVPNGT